MRKVTYLPDSQTFAAQARRSAATYFEVVPHRKKSGLPVWNWVAIAVLATALSGRGTDYAGWAVGNSSDGYGTILYTADSGGTWVRQGAGMIADGDVGGICALDPSTAWAVGSAVNGYCAIYRTTDAGQSWTRMGSPLSLPNADLFKVNALDARQLWAVGFGVILHTGDAGATWVNQTPAGFDGLLFQGVFTPDGTNVWATGDTKDGYATILKSTDAGQSWVRQSGGSVTNVDHLLSVAATDGNHAWAVGGLGNNILKTSDGGANWQMMDQGGGMDANELAVVTFNDVWVALDGAVKWTHDGGQSWGTHTTPLYTLGIAVTDTTNAWAVAQGYTGKGTIYHTSDGGTNWEEQTVTGGPPAGLRIVSFASQPVGKGEWSFVMLGDTRGDRTNTTTGISLYLNTIAQKIASLNPELVLVCGDLVNGNDVPSGSPLEDYAIQFTNWTAAMQPVFNYSTGTGIQIYPVRGNHENCDNEGPTIQSLKKAYYNTFRNYVPLNGPNYGLTNDQVGFSYWFTRSNVTFVAADLYFYYNETPGLEGYHELDREWVAQQFHGTKSAYKVFMAHVPFFQTESSSASERFFGTNAAGYRTRADFWNVLGSNGVQLYLTGHIHNETVASTTNDYGNTIIQLMAGNGGAPLDPVGTVSEPGVDVLYTNDMFGFALATVRDDAMTIQYYSLNTNNNSWTVADYATRIRPNQVVPVNPINITYSVSGTALTLIWPEDHTGWVLQAQTNALSAGIGTNWVAVPGSSATNQMTMPMGSGIGSMFYRLFLP